MRFMELLVERSADHERYKLIVVESLNCVVRNEVSITQYRYLVGNGEYLLYLM